MSSNNDGWFGLDKLRSWLPKWQWSKDSFGRTYRNYLYNSDVPVLIDKHEVLIPYLDCPHLQIPINKKCDMFSNGMLKCVSVDDEEKEFPDDDGYKLMLNPNPLQSFEEFLWQYMFYRSVFANNFIYKLSGSALTLPKVLWHLPSELMKIKLTGKFFDQYERSGIIQNYLLCDGGYEKKYDVKDVIYQAQNFSYTEGMGTSKIPGLNYPISNIMAALKTRNIISVKKGMIGFISNEGKDTMGGNIPMKPAERERIEKQFSDDRGLYGDRENIIIANSASKWNPTSFPVRDLMLLEGVDADAACISEAFGISKNILPWGNDNTYENVKAGMKGTYQNTIQPEADSFMGMMSEELGATARGRKYILDYSWLPIMKEDELIKAQEAKLETERLAMLYGYNIISRGEFAKLAGVELGEEIQAGTDSLGKIPLALQQLALARERANTAGDKQLSAQLSEAMDKLTTQLVQQVINK